MLPLCFLVLCHILALGLSVCPAGWARHGSSCYYIYEDTLNRSAAASLCGTRSGHLVTFPAESDWVYISSLMMAVQLSSAAWTGLIYANNSWGWPNATTYTELHHWYNPMLDPNYVPKADVSYSQAKLYMSGTQTYLMADLASTVLHPFCERAVDSRDLCDVTEDWVILLGECYKPLPPATWSDAVSTCSDLGGKVLSPNSAQELQPVNTLTNVNTSFWIGASYQDSGYYFAADHRTVDYLPWLHADSNYTNPTQTCMAAVRLNGSIGYFMNSCDVELTFFCIRPVGTCPLGWYLDGTRCYTLHIRPEERMTWFMAVDYCKARNAVIAEELSTDANTLMYNVLLENDVHLAWLGFSGSGWPYKDMNGKTLFGNVYAFDTTNTTGGPSRCGVTDFDPRRNGLFLASYCYTPHPFVCTLPLTDSLTPVLASNVSCGAGWVLFNNECYTLMMTPMMYDDAVDNCRSMGAQIVSISSTMQQSFFSTPDFMSYGLEYYWIGVKYNLSSGHYVLQETNKDAQFWNFDPDQLYNSSYAPCVYVGTGSDPPFIGSWFAELCSATHNFVCKKPSQPVGQVPRVSTTLWYTQCGIGWTYDNVTNLCYFVSPYVHKPWREARADCLARQGDLLSIDGEDEQLAVENLLKSDAYNSLGESLWIGAGDLTDRYGWGWSDSRPFRYFHWAEDEPQYNSDDGDNCANIPVTKLYEWETRPCGDKLGFICRKSASVSTGRPPTPTPSSSCQQPQPLISGDHSIQFPQDFSASSSKDAQHSPDDCRMIPVNNASWSPATDSVDEWLAVSFHSPVTIVDIEIRGEDSTDKYVSKFKLQYQYDARSPWYWFTNTDKSVRIFDGVTVPDGSTAVYLFGEIQAHAVKIWPVEWSYGIAIQLELSGCPEEECLPDGALGGPFFVDDRNLRASSELPGFESWNARLNPGRDHRQLSIWMPASTDTSPWIEVDLGKKRIIQAVTIAGDDAGNYVAEFQLMLSQSPGDPYITYMEPYGVPFIFSTTIGIGSSVTTYLGSSIEARVVRLVLLSWVRKAALKFDVLVCTSGCTAEPIIAKLPSSQLSASDDDDYHIPSRSKLNTQRSGDQPDAWQPLRPTVVDSSYIQADLGSVMQVISVATQGSASDSLWVTSYYLAFSTDGQTFRRYGGNVTFYTIANRVTVYNETVLYQGNFDGSTVVKNDLAQPVNARYVRLYPHSFQTAIAVRWEIYACSKHTASTPLGCYADDPADPDLPYVPFRDQYASMWPEACLSYCYDMGYSYAGLQNGDLCSCGNLYGMYGVADGCNISCKDPYTNFTCGGLNKNMVFSTGLSANTLICPAGWRAYRDSCYSLIDQDTWANAKNTCQKMGAHLVDISDMGENDMVAGVIGDDSWREFDNFDIGQNSWIGFSDDRSNLNFEWSSRANVNFTNWGRHQPKANPGLQQNSVIISPDGSWTNTFSDDINAFICETAKKPSSDAQSDHQDNGCLLDWRAGDLKCYRFYRQKIAWAEAQTFCISQGVSLARADTVKENIVLSALLSELDGHYWLDIRDGNSTGLYTHSAGMVDVAYTNWAKLKPDSIGRCVSVGTGQHAGEWTNEACDSGNRFVCETARIGYYPQTPVSPAIHLPCPSGWQPHGAFCYQFNIATSNSLLTWHEANENCMLQSATLASFHGDVDFDAVVANLSKTVGNFWIGLNNLDASTGYEWSDGSVMNFVRWGDGQPDISQPLLVCGEVLLDTQTLGLQMCSEKRNWICSVQKGKTVTNITTDDVPEPENSGSCRPLENTWSKYQDYCYYISNGDGDTDDALTWRQSHQWCQKYGANLASVTSANENAFLRGMLNHGIPVEAAWIGLNELDRGHGYSWSDGTPVGSWQLNWDVDEPNDYSGFEGCVEMLARNGRWGDIHCSTRQGFVCKQPAPGVNVTKPIPVTRHSGNCPPNFSRHGYKCYRVMGMHEDMESETWASAQSSCKYMMFGSHPNYTIDLASITTQEENAFMTTLLSQYKLSAWLGMKRLPSGQYVWEDNEDLDFEGWNKNQPNSADGNASCVYMAASSGSVGKWNAGSCQDKYPYICQGFVDPAFPAVVVPPSPQCNVTDAFQPFATSCYKVVNQSMTWQDARAYCSTSKSYLASVVDGFDWAELFLLSHNYSSGVWIGLKDLESPGVYRWDSGYPVTYTRWAHHQPQDNAGCVYMDNTGLFNKDQCSEPRACVCRYDAIPPQEIPSQPGDFCSISNFIQHGSMCYLLALDTKLTYEMAGRDCELRGATLASIHNSSLMFNMAHGQGVWIGLRESDTEGFSWEDSTVLDYTQWAPREPAWSGDEAIEEGCVVMFWDGKWANVDCDNTYGYLCSLPAAAQDHPVTVPPISVTQNTPTLPSTLTPVPYSQATPPSPSPAQTPSASSSQLTSSPAQTSLPSSSQFATTSSQLTSSTSHSSKPTVLPSQEKDSAEGLSGGDTAGIVIGVIIVVILVIGIIFSIYRCGIRRSSFLRREASRVKNFENSLYAETRKDTLTKSEDIRGINIVGLESDPRSVSVSYSVGRGLRKPDSVEYNAGKCDLADHNSEEIGTVSHNSEGFDFSAYNTEGFDSLAYNPIEFNFAARNFEAFDDIDMSTA